VALEYPVLAIIASILFISIVFSSLYLYLYIVSEVNRIPVVSGYATVGLSNSNWVINITVRLERGEPVEFQKAMLTTEEGAKEVTEAKLYGFRDRVLLPGGVGLIRIELQGSELTYNKTYSGLVVFDKGTLVITYTTPPPPG